MITDSYHLVSLDTGLCLEFVDAFSMAGPASGSSTQVPEDPENHVHTVRPGVVSGQGDPLPDPPLALFAVGLSTLILDELLYLLLYRSIEEHGEDGGSRPVDGHGDARQGVGKIEIRIKLLHVVESRDGDTALADLAVYVRPLVRILTVERNAVESRRESFGFVVTTEEVKATVGALGASLTGELASRFFSAHETRHLRPLAANGVLYHHAGMLPIDKEIVERLFTTGLVKMLFATETFSLGVNMPARTVAFQALCKFDGIQYGPILARDYWQMAGRAGRQGIDDRGWVFALLDETRIDHHDIERLQSGRTEPVVSRFNMSYSGILNLYRRVGDKVTDAWSRSFARFQRARKRKGGGSGGARQIRARLAVLEAYDYIRDGTLTRKGELCARVNGYEIAATEALEKGWIGRCDPVQLVMLFAAMVYEPRRFDDSAPPTRPLKGIAVPFTLHMESFASTELAHRVGAPTRVPDFGIAGPVQLWAEGVGFDRVLAKTSLAPGDLVRLLRMTIQMLRQVEHALDPEDPTRESLRAARDLIDRDVVDARRQLELG